MAIINPKNAVLDSDIIMPIVSSDPNANFQYFDQLVKSKDNNPIPAYAL